MDFQSSLNKLADTLKMQLQYKDGTISGSVQRVFSPFEGLSIPLNVQATKVFANDAVGVMVHVSGDLYMVASHLPKTGVVSVFLIDKAKLGIASDPATLITKSMTIKQVIGLLRHGVVQSFLYKDRKWSTLKLPT